jgi:glycosyltransferase
MPPHPTFFVRKSVYKKYGLFNLSLGSAADYELMLSTLEIIFCAFLAENYFVKVLIPFIGVRFLVRHEITTAYIPEVLVCMRTGGMSNVSVKNRIIANRMDRKAWAVNDLKPYPWTLFLKPLRKMPQFFQKPS